MNRYIKISSTGERLPDDATEWVAIEDTTTNLIWDRYESREKYAHADIGNHTSGMTLAGYNDWRPSTRVETFGITDDSKFGPAIDTRYFDSHGDFVWTSTLDESDKTSFAWAVFFRSGRVYIHYRGLRFRVRAVRSARQ